MHFEYEDLVRAFEQSLLTQLRSHGAQSDFLRTWVPDPDLTKSLINMADAAALEGVGRFGVGLSADALPDINLPELAAALSGVFRVATGEPKNGRVGIEFISANSP